MNVFGFELGEATASLFGTFLSSISIGLIYGLVRYMFFGRLERKD